MAVEEESDLGAESSEAREFSSVEAAAGGALIGAAAVAVVWANSPWSAAYHHFWNHPLDSHFLGLEWPHTPVAWVSDLLMAVYFFVAGLEIKREITSGELHTARRAAFPVAAALGGMLVPALVYALINSTGPAANGWGVPMATDIAFALGVLAVIGRGLPAQVRVFLLSLAIVDDVGSIAVIAIFYSRSLEPVWFLVAVGFVIVIYGGYHVRGQRLSIVAVGAAGLWISLFQAGIHPTIAGVVTALLTPAVENAGGGSTAEHLLHRIHPWSSFVIAPLFAFASAGVTMSVVGFRTAVHDRVSIGVFLGLVVGKPVGILAGAAIAARFGWATRPKELSWRSLAGVGALGGIGFTVSFLITELAFTREATRNASELAILLAAVVAVVAATPVLIWARRGLDVGEPASSVQR